MAQTITKAFTAPVGRLVQGDPYTASEKDMNGQPRVVKNGPNAGKPNPQFFVAVAIRKDDPAWPAFERELKDFGAQQWASLFPQGAYGATQPRNFSWKIADGDGIDHYNAPNWEKPGFAGHWVVSFTSAYAPKIWALAGGQYVDIANNKGEIKRGYYIQVSGNWSSNDNPQNPGMYQNLQQILFVAKGEEIITGPTAQQAFGAGPAALPPGAQALDARPAPPGAPAAPAPAPAAFPPAGWTAHPQSPGYFYQGQEVLSEADLRARFAPPPAPAPAAPPAAPPPAPAPAPAAWSPPPGWTAHPQSPGYYYQGQEVLSEADLKARFPQAPAAPPTPPGAPIAPGPVGSTQTPISAPATSPAPTTPPPVNTSYYTQPAPAPQAPPPAAPARQKTPQERMTAAATTTYDAYIAGGWTEDQMIAAGVMEDYIPF